MDARRNNKKGDPCNNDTAYTNPMKRLREKRQKAKEVANISFHVDEATGDQFSYNETTGETKWLDEEIDAEATCTT